MADKPVPDLNLDPAMPRPVGKQSGRGLIVPSKTSVVREADLPSGRSIQVRHGDITKEDTEFIVNPANEMLVHGSGVSGTIMRNGGRKIKKESDDWVVAHGKGGDAKEVAELLSAIKLSLAAAKDKKADSISFPSLIPSGWPRNLVAALTFHGVLEHWKEDPSSTVKHIRFTNYDLETTAVFKDEFDRRAKEQFAPTPLPPSIKDWIAALPQQKEADLLGDDDVSDMLETIALSRAANKTEQAQQQK